MIPGSALANSLSGPAYLRMKSAPGASLPGFDTLVLASFSASFLANSISSVSSTGFTSFSHFRQGAARQVDEDSRIVGLSRLGAASIPEGHQAALRVTWRLVRTRQTAASLTARS